MKLLLDTCTFLWIMDEDEKLSARALKAFEDPAHEVYLSVVSVWEVVVKHRLGRLDLTRPPGRLVPEAREQHGLWSLPMDDEAALQEGGLPPIHTDPVDRMLVCQAIVHGLTILTPDAAIRAYPVRTLW